MEHFNLTKKLHTDVLEGQYGPIHSEVLRHDGEIREVHMVDSENISRTYALTFLTFDKDNSELSEIDSEIKNGGLIGKTFREHGFEVRKNVISVFLVDLPMELKNKMKTKVEKAKVRLSEFYAKKEGSEPIIYGIVSEVYSPDFRPPEVNDADLAQDNPITSAMEEAGISKEEIWEGLGSSFDNLKDKMEKAKVLAESEESSLILRVKQKLNN